MQALGSSQTMFFAQLLVGVLLLFLGRKIFWLFLGGIGFVAGMTLATRFIGSDAGATPLVVGLVGGLVGALVAVFIQKIAVAIAGFLGGGMLGYFGAQMLGWQTEHFPWIPVIICGVLGVLFAALLFKWAITVLSSIVGAFVLVNAFSLVEPLASILIVVLAVVGIIVQASLDRKKKEPAS